MASIQKRGNSYRIRVSNGRDSSGKQLMETITFTPDPTKTEKQNQKALEIFVMEFEQRKDGKPGGYAPRTVKHVHVLINSIYSAALKWNVTFDNPCSRVDPPKMIRNTCTGIALKKSRDMMRPRQAGS